MNPTSPPARSNQQRMDALARANAIRSQRAQLKRNIRAGRCTVTQVVMFPAPEVETMKVFELLLSAPKIGRTKADRKMRTAQVSPSKTIGGLSGRQRSQLVIELGGR